MTTGVKDATLKPLGYTKTASAGSVLTPTIQAGARYLMIKCETKAFRWRDDGTNPDTNTGMLIDVGDEFWYSGNLAALRFIEDGATSTATLHISQYR